MRPASHQVDIMQMCVVELQERPGKPLFHLEHYIEGKYIKYNSNSGFVRDDNMRLTPQVGPLGRRVPAGVGSRPQRTLPDLAVHLPSSSPLSALLLPLPWAEPGCLRLSEQRPARARTAPSPVSCSPLCLLSPPQAFSHFTFERSGHQLIVVDIQGVGDLYTDPQIHTEKGTDFGDGNLGRRGEPARFHGDHTPLPPVS